MTTFSRWTACFTLSLLALGSANRADAGMEMFTANFGSSTSPLTVPFTTTLALQSFDTSMGTLTGVELILTNNANISAAVVNLGTAAMFTGATGNSSVVVTGPDTTTATATASTGPYTGTLAAGLFGGGTGTPTFMAAPAFATASGTDVISQGNFAAYEGAGGQMFNVVASSTNGGSGSSNGSFTTFGSTSSSYGSLEVIYTFTPATVPEPASMVMLGLGLGVVAVAGRCRRRAA